MKKNTIDQQWHCVNHYFALNYFPIAVFGFKNGTNKSINSMAYKNAQQATWLARETLLLRLDQQKIIKTTIELYIYAQTFYADVDLNASCVDSTLVVDDDNVGVIFPLKFGTQKISNKT
jgi:hypothetical protein